MKKYLFISVIFIIFVIGYFNISFANSEVCKISMDVKSSANKNETLNIKLKLSNINNNEGISAINGVIDFDTDVFEKIDYEKTTDWNNLNELNNVVFILTTNMEEKYEDSDILNIKLKVKENAKVGDTTIKFSKIDVIGKSNTINSLEDIEKSIKINDVGIPIDTGGNNQNGNQGSEGDNGNQGSESNNGNSQNGNNSQQQGQENGENADITEESNYQIRDSQNAGTIDQDASLADKILSNTGLRTSIVLAIVLISLSVVFYIKYKKIK